ESTFYRVGVSVVEAPRVLDEQLANLRELARYIVAYVSSVVLADERVLTNRAFVDGIDLQNFRFDSGAMSDRYAQCAKATEPYKWSFDPFVLSHLQTEPHTFLAQSIAATG